MKILLFEMPSREENNSPPFGILYTAGAMLKNGQSIKIINLYIDKLTENEIKKEIENYKPEVIGFGGIVSSYRNLKNISIYIKKQFPHIIQIAGGVIGAIEEILLKKTKIDLIVKGESESIWPELYEYLKGRKSIEKIAGIVYLKNDKLIFNQAASLIQNLDLIEFPPYHLLKMEKYLLSVKSWFNFYFIDDNDEKTSLEKELQNYPYLFPILSSRGCTHKCCFCYRHMPKIRQNSVDYVIRHMLYLKEKYKIGLFQFCDELTTYNKKWVMEFAKSAKENKIKYIILSARVNNVDEEMLKNLKESGCLMINYGYESGSDEILKYIGKGTTREMNIKAALLTRKIGIKNIPELMIGFPNETEKTLKETISFLKEIDLFPFSVNFVLPFPKTPLWDYCLKNNLIKNEEEFILNYKDAFHFIINLTKYKTWKVKNWRRFVIYKALENYYRRRKKILEYLKSKFKRNLGTFKNFLTEKIKSIKLLLFF